VVASGRTYPVGTKVLGNYGRVEEYGTAKL